MAKRQHIFTGIDIGSDSLKLVSAVKSQETDTLEVLGVVEKKSAGVRRGVVVDHETLSHLLFEAGQSLEEKIGNEVQGAFVNIGGSHIFSQNSRGLISVSRADQNISQEDVERVLGESKAFSLPPNREIIKVLPKEYIVDGQEGIQEPVGLKGVRLEAKATLIVAFGPYKNNLELAVEHAGFDMEGMIASPLAAASSVLSDHEKELGAVLIDIGAGTTSMAVFQEGTLACMAVFPVGGAHITNDIAAFLECDVELAEKVKIELGSCMSPGNDKKEKIELDEETISFSRKKLSHVIDQRVDQILSAVEDQIKEVFPTYRSSGRGTYFPAGFVLTGGTAHLRKIREYAKKRLKSYCKIGTPRMDSSFPLDSRFSVACGLVESFASEQDMSHGILTGGGTIGGKIKKALRAFIP